MTAGRHDNALQRLETEIWRLRQDMRTMRDRVGKLEAQSMSRRALATAVLAGAPIITGVLVLAITVGDRLWGT